jgi:DNA-binding MarR family transcriptional regulator
METFQRMLALRHHFKAVPPESMATIKAYLDEERLKGKASAMNFNLFFNVGAILSGDSAPVTMGELSHMLDVPLSTATRIVDWMVERGYVQRMHDPSDRRIVRLGLTENGRELYDTIYHFIRGRIEIILHELTPAERESLITLTHRLLDIFERHELGEAEKE